MLSGQLLIFNFQRVHLLSQLLNIASLHSQRLLDRVVKAIDLLQLIVHIRVPLSRVTLTVSVSALLSIQLRLFFLNLVEGLLTTFLVELLLQLLHVVAQVADVLDQFDVL